MAFVTPANIVMQPLPEETPAAPMTAVTQQSQCAVTVLSPVMKAATMETPPTVMVAIATANPPDAATGKSPLENFAIMGTTTPTQSRMLVEPIAPQHHVAIQLLTRVNIATPQHPTMLHLAHKIARTQNPRHVAMESQKALSPVMMATLIMVMGATTTAPKPPVVTAYKLVTKPVMTATPVTLMPVPMPVLSLYAVMACGGPTSKTLNRSDLRAVTTAIYKTPITALTIAA